ncbi:MAG TPA: trypsin-like peptidase domain-containing protein [Pyrinomonadaceae bacterium]|nr:trypsin-like peptidase domain-containing protein [Pyrinomonadaceae bacterium]
MSSYVCPRCGKKGPALLRPDQLCQGCISNWAWGTASGSNQVVKITPEAVAAPEPKPETKAAPVKTSLRTWITLLVSLVSISIAVVLLVYFFTYAPSGVSGRELIGRYNNFASFAGLSAALSWLASVSLFDIAKKLHLTKSARVLRAVSFILASGVFGTAVFCWMRTESLALLLPSQQNNDLAQRLQSATVGIQMYDRNVNRYSSIKREGVIVAVVSGHTLILTVPYIDGNGRPMQPNDLWVNLSDGRTLPARFIFAVAEPANLAIVEVTADAPPGQVQFHPAAEATIPSKSVFVVPTPFDGWTIDQATVVNRFTRRTNMGWNCVVETDLKLDRNDVGSAMYDDAGRLLGFMISFDPDSGNSRFVMVDSATVAALEGLRGRKDTNAQNSSQEQQP